MRAEISTSGVSCSEKSAPSTLCFFVLVSVLVSVLIGIVVGFLDSNGREMEDGGRGEGD